MKRERTCNGIPHNRIWIVEGGSGLSIGIDFLRDTGWGLLISFFNRLLKISNRDCFEKVKMVFIRNQYKNNSSERFP